MKELPLIACALDEVGQAARVGEFRALLERAISTERIDGGARIVLPVALAAETRELLAAEQRCCAFWDFRVTQEVGRVVVEARAPAEAAAMVERLFNV